MIVYRWEIGSLKGGELPLGAELESQMNENEETGTTRGGQTFDVSGGSSDFNPLTVISVFCSAGLQAGVSSLL